MLVGRDHAGGKRSCWQGKIMLVGKDHVSGEGSCWLWKMVNVAELWFLHRKNTLFAQNGSLSVRSQQKSQQTICLLAADLISYASGAPRQAHVEITPKKYEKHLKGRPLVLPLNCSTTTITTTTTTTTTSWGIKSSNTPTFFSPIISTWAYFFDLET